MSEQFNGSILQNLQDSVFIEESSLTSIGNAIREKTGGSELLTVPDGMVEAIGSITGGTYNKHYNTCVLEYAEFFDECYFNTGYDGDYEGYYYCPNMYTQAELDDMTSRVEAGEMDYNYGDYIAYEVYDTDWNLVYSGKSGMAGEISGWYVSFGQPPAGLVVGETYYVTRGDYQKQANTNLPIHNFDFEEGKKAEYDWFWDIYQNNGSRLDYQYAFAGNGWNAENFKPKYTIYPTNCGNGFRSSAIRKIDIDFSRCTSLANCWASCTDLEDAGTINLKSIRNNSHSYLLTGCTSLHTVKIIFGTNITVSTNLFNNCTALQNLIVEGVIATTGFNVQWSTKLSHESLMSIINALADKSTDTSGTVWEIILGDENKAKLTSEELQIAQNKNWVVN